MKPTRLMLAVTAACVLASPALAISKEDRIIFEQSQGKVLAAKNNPEMVRYGGAQIDEAERALDDLRRNLDNDDAKDVRNIMNRIDALIETAETRVKIAKMREETANLQKSAAQASVQSAEARAAAAERQAQAAQAQAETLRNRLREFEMRQTALGAQLVLQDVIFETGKAALRPGAEGRLRPLVSYLTATPNVRVRIEGHTDSTGDAAMNQRLSEARAMSVRNVLVATGVDASRIETIGHGETRPIATNATVAGRQANRRVELTLIGQQLDRQIAATTQ